MTTPNENLQVRLASRPDGAIVPSNWQFTRDPISEIADGDILVQTLVLSLDPAMRGWINEGATYMAPVALGAVMRAGGIGRVITSRSPGFSAGDIVFGQLGAQEFAHIQKDDLQSVGLVKIDLTLGSPVQWLNILGMPGVSAYFGLSEIGKPKPGETVVISAAAGAVGQTAGQLARLAGARVVGIAGGQRKCDWVVNELGFDACIDYKSGTDAVREGLVAHCPQGVDVYFDNVGGDILDDVLAHLALRARVIICGAISQYNNPGSFPATGPRNYLNLLIQRARMEGMLVFDYADRFPEAIGILSSHIAKGELKSREEIVTGGVLKFPEALNMLFKGQNLGKLMLHVAD